VTALGGFEAYYARPASARFVPSLTAPAALRRRTRVSRHLVIAYRPGWQSLEDLNEIAGHVADLDPSIRTFILPSTHQNSVTRKEAAERPTLVVSAGEMPKFRAVRGKVYQGRIIPKWDEVRLLQAAGLPVPKTELLRPGIKLDPAEWGEFVIVKPTDLGTSSLGLGIQLMRSHRVRYIAPQDYPAGHPGRLGPMLVQQYVNAGGHVKICRVLTLFGEPLYILENTSPTPVIDFSAPDEILERRPVAHQALGDEMNRVFIKDADMIALAKRAHEAIPDVPLKGVDIIRETGTGKLYLLELNCRGNTWHFSSSFMAAGRAKLGPEFEWKRRYQFDAMRTSARVLVARTVAEAV
jgi:hypothetical protein